MRQKPVWQMVCKSIIFVILVCPDLLAFSVMRLADSIYHMYIIKVFGTFYELLRERESRKRGATATSVEATHTVRFLAKLEPFRCHKFLFLKKKMFRKAAPAHPKRCSFKKRMFSSFGNLTVCMAATRYALSSS